MIKRLKSAICFGIMVATLASCSQEENVPLNEMKGDLVVLKVDFDGIEEIQPEGASTRSASTGPRTHIEELGGDLVLETSVVADVAEVSEQTKAVSRGVSDMVTGTRVAAIVYKKNGTPYKLQQMVKGSAELHLPLGEEFRIVFYSYNSAVEPKVQVTGTARPDGNGGWLLSPNATVEINNEKCGTNVMWGRIDDTGKISQTTKLQNIVFTPVFNQLSWELSTTGSDVLKVSGAQIANTFSSADVDMNILRTATNKLNVWQGIGNVSTNLTFSPNQGVKVISTRKQFIANPTKESRLNALIDVAGASKPIEYSLGSLERGVRYKVISKLTINIQKYSVRFSSSGPGRINNSGTQEGTIGEIKRSTATSSSSDAIFDGWYENERKIVAESNADETVSGSSLTGATLSVKLTARTSGKTYVARFRDLEGGAPRIDVSGTGDNAKLILIKNFTYGGAYFQGGSILAWNSSGRVVYNPSQASNTWNSAWTSDMSHTLDNLRAGKGDPCRLVGYTQKYVRNELAAGRVPDNKTWRTPSVSDNRIFSDYVAKNITIVGINGALFTSREEFLPKSGWLDIDTGRLTDLGTGGCYWSHTRGAGKYSPALYFRGSTFDSGYESRHGFGLGVRCVPQ